MALKTVTSISVIMFKFVFYIFLQGLSGLRFGPTSRKQYFGSYSSITEWDYIYVVIVISLKNDIVIENKLVETQYIFFISSSFFFC